MKELIFRPQLMNELCSWLIAYYTAYNLVAQIVPESAEAQK